MWYHSNSWLGEVFLPVSLTLKSKMKMSRILVPCALFATGLGILLSIGCDRVQEAPPADSTSPASYMNDTNFLGRLKEMRGERQDLASRRAKVVAEMKAMVDAKRAAMKGSGDAAVKAALEKDAAWQSLMKRLGDLDVALKESRRKAMGVARARIAPKRADRSGEDAASALKKNLK